MPTSLGIALEREKREGWGKRSGYTRPKRIFSKEKRKRKFKKTGEGKKGYHKREVELDEIPSYTPMLLEWATSRTRKALIGLERPSMTCELRERGGEPGD